MNVIPTPAHMREIQTEHLAGFDCVSYPADEWTSAGKTQMTASGQLHRGTTRHECWLLLKPTLPVRRCCRKCLPLRLTERQVACRRVLSTLCRLVLGVFPEHVKPAASNRTRHSAFPCSCFSDTALRFPAARSGQRDTWETQGSDRRSGGAFLLDDGMDQSLYPITDTPASSE